MLCGFSRRRLKAGAAFALLALLAELTGRALTARLDGALNVAPLATPTTRYYPFLLAGVRALAALARRRRRLAARARACRGRRGRAAPRADRPRAAALPACALSPRLWLVSFARDLALVPAPERRRAALRRAAGRCSRPGSTPTRCRSSPSARSCSRSAGAPCATGSPTSSDYAAATLARARRLLRVRRCRRFARRLAGDDRAPRHLFGLAFESRPPPLRRLTRGSAPSPRVVVSTSDHAEGRRGIATRQRATGRAGLREHARARGRRCSGR